MIDFKETLRAAIAVEPGSVWYADDKIITLHQKERKFKESRPVLIACHDGFIHDDHIPIIPLTTSVDFSDRLVFPVARGYKFVYESTDFEINQNSHAIIDRYQIIKRQGLIAPCGILDETTYHAILHILCKDILKVPFMPNYDLE
ncbi:MAG TPA: hypothetical protein VEW28_10775 [Candidatus Kapabacteria bacterium]|nr:hypothetical protein [Candidatus Kapabacteria bacterium]